METRPVKYPIGIQDFEKLRTNGYLYVDKTMYIHKLVSEGMFYFLSRPRRFGKSLFLSTIEAFFRGRKDLFSGLALERLQPEEWPTDIPIFRMDLSPNDFSNYEALEKALKEQLVKWERIYGRDEAEDSLSSRFGGVIERASEQTHQDVVILIDEYDGPIIANLHNPELAEKMRNLLKALYTNIKAKSRYIRFAMITGVSRFSRLSIFSGLNNLEDISLKDDFAAICGVTEEELKTNFQEGISWLAKKQGETYDEALEHLKQEYDGYRFSDYGEGIYNPFSLINCLKDGKYGHYWYATGTPTFLIKKLERENWDLYDLLEKPVTAETLSDIESYGKNPIAILYQTGYLTIKNYNPKSRRYTLDFPNNEVRESFIEGLLPLYTRQPAIAGTFILYDFVEALKTGDVDGFMHQLDTLFANIPYDDAIKEESDVRNIITAVFFMTMGYVPTEIHTFRGRIDVVVTTADYRYIIELKYAHSVEEALRQIEERDYAKPFALDGRQLIKLGVNFDPKSRSLQWGVAKNGIQFGSGFNMR